MNITEAHEELLEAARSMIAKAEEQGFPHIPCIIRLKAAVRIMTPRVARMRARLDDQRARRAGKPTCPAWAKP